MSTTIDDPNITLYDGSSWKQYNDATGGWHGGTYHETCDDRDDLTFVFSGTAIQVYGAKRPTYGYYYAELDGENRRFFNAHSVTDEIPALLFEANHLDNIEHSLWFMNQQNYGDQRSRSCIGIDYIVVQQSNATGSDAPQASGSDSAVAVSQPPGTVTSDPNASPVSTDPAASSSVSPDPNTVVGQPITSTATGGNDLTVPNLASFTIAPSAAEVTAPNATWVADSAMTAVTGRPGVYSGQTMPVYTAIKYDAAPRLQQEVFASAVRAGATTNAGVTGSMPSVSLGLICALFWSIRRFWAI